MKQIMRCIALVAALLPGLAAAQVPNFPQTVPPNTVLGRLGIGPGPVQAIPTAQLFSKTLLDQFSSTPGAMLYRGVGGWQALSPGVGLLYNNGTTPSWISPVPIANGGTGQITAPAARASAGLNIEAYTPHGDSNYTIVATDRTVGTNATLTAARTWTLPAASAVNPGQTITVADYFGSATNTNKIIISRAGSDTINGANTTEITSGYQQVTVRSDGTSKWSIATGSVAGSTLPWKSPTDYGALCNGTADDKTALQAWLDAIAGTYVGYIPPGKTCTWGNGSNGSSGNGLIFVKSNTTIIGNGSIFKILATAPLNSGLMLTDPTQGTAAGPSNVRISGLNLDGSKTARGCVATAGPFQCSAATLFVVGAQDIYIENSKCIEGASDCFYVGGNITTSGPSRRVYMNNITCVVAARNCLSVVGVFVMNLTGCNMSGAITAPGHGIDVEPDSTNTPVNDLTISQCTLGSNGGDGISINPGNIANAVNRGFGFMIISSGNTGSGFSQYNTAASLNGWKFAGAFGTGNGVALFAPGPSLAVDKLP